MNRVVLLASAAVLSLTAGAAAAPPPYDTPAPIAYLVDLSSGAVLLSKDADRRIGRRALIVGGTAAAVGSAVLARDELARLWWRIPGMERPRDDGAVDYAGATWVAASDANWRRADRPARPARSRPPRRPRAPRRRPAAW